MSNALGTEVESSEKGIEVPRKGETENRPSGLGARVGSGTKKRPGN